MNTLYNITTANLHISKGNSKLGHGVYNISFVPGNKEYRPKIRGTVVSNVVGTCSKHCGQCASSRACYAFKSFIRHHNATVQAWSENTLLLRSGKLFNKVAAWIEENNNKYYTTKNEKDHKVKVFRINNSGEVENYEQLEGWNKLALGHPEVNFSIYTKNYQAVEEFLKKHNDTADNFVINISQWNHEADDFIKKYGNKFNIFEYDGTNRKDNNYSKEDTQRLNSLTHCPAVDKHGHKTGITCSKCGRCYRKTNQTTAVFAH